MAEQLTKEIISDCEKDIYKFNIIIRELNYIIDIKYLFLCNNIYEDIKINKKCNPKVNEATAALIKEILQLYDKIYDNDMRSRYNEVPSSRNKMMRELCIGLCFRMCSLNYETIIVFQSKNIGNSLKKLFFSISEECNKILANEGKLKKCIYECNKEEENYILNFLNANTRIYQRCNYILMYLRNVSALFDCFYYNGSIYYKENNVDNSVVLDSEGQYHNATQYTLSKNFV